MCACAKGRLQASLHQQQHVWQRCIMISALPLEGLWLSVCMSNHFEIMSDRTLCSRISLPKDPNNCRSVQAIVIPCSYVFLRARPCM